MIVNEPVNIGNMEQNVQVGLSTSVLDKCLGVIQEQEDMAENTKTQLTANRERLDALTKANRPLLEERDAHEARKTAQGAEVDRKRVRDEFVLLEQS